MLQPNIQVIELDKKEYVVLDKIEYQKLMELLEDLEDCRLIDEAKAASTKSYTIEEIAKEFDVDLDELRSKRKHGVKVEKDQYVGIDSKKTKLVIDLYKAGWSYENIVTHTSFKLEEVETIINCCKENQSRVQKLNAAIKD